MIERGRQPHNLLSAMRRAAVLLAFVAMVAQLAASGLHAAAMPMDAADGAMRVTALPCAAMCGSAIVHVCLPASRVCAAVVATFMHPSLIDSLVLALVALIAVTITARSRGVAFRSWLWSPDRRRAFLQVFQV